MREELRLPSALPGLLFRYAPRGALFPRHAHDELELNLVVSGHARWLLDDRRYDVVPRSLVWLFPQQEHVLVDLTRDFTMWILVAKPAALSRWCRDAGDRQLRSRDPAGSFCRRLDRDGASLLGRVFADVAAAPASRRIEHGLAYAVLTAWKLFGEAPAGAAVQVHPGVERAAADLARGDRPLSEVAAKAGLSLSRLRHLFSSQIGQSLVDYRSHRRLERFLALAGDGRKRLDACALSAGFGSYPQFHRVFRRIMGMSPGTWRRSGGESAGLPDLTADLTSAT